VPSSSQNLRICSHARPLLNVTAIAPVHPVHLCYWQFATGIHAVLRDFWAFPAFLAFYFLLVLVCSLPWSISCCIFSLTEISGVRSRSPRRSPECSHVSHTPSSTVGSWSAYRWHYSAAMCARYSTTRYLLKQLEAGATLGID